MRRLSSEQRQNQAGHSLFHKEKNGRVLKKHAAFRAQGISELFSDEPQFITKINIK